jgi:hypothetical protein
MIKLRSGEIDELIKELTRVRHLAVGVIAVAWIEDGELKIKTFDGIVTEYGSPLKERS